MKTFYQLAKENGFKLEFVSGQEHTDGVGATVGMNFTKNDVWYTPKQFADECGFEIKTKSAKLQAKNVDDVKRQIVAWCKENALKALHFNKSPNEFGPGMFYVRFRYVK